MDTQPGQIQIPHDNDPNQGQPQQPVDGSSAQVPLPSVQVTPVTTPPQVPGAAPQNPAPAPQPLQAQPESQPPAPAMDASSQTSGLSQDAGWQYDNGADGADIEPLPEDVRWSAAEFVEHPKSAGWYGLLILAAIVLSGVDYFVTKDLFSAIIIIFAAAMFGVYAGHKPRTQSYYLSPKGLQIGEKIYSFHSFKAFSVAEEGATASIMFTPLARFAAPLTIYVNMDIEERVLDYLSQFLPFEQRRADAVDGLLRRIRF